MFNITVIIPTHNRPDLLERAIQSVLNQTLLPFEIIVVDDVGSKDSIKVLDLFQSDLLHYVFNESGKGPSSSRNLGVGVAKGEFIAFLDDDDEFMPEKIAELSNVIRADPEVDVIYHAASIFMVNEDITYNSKPYEFKTKDDIFKNLLVQNRVGGTPMVTVKKSTFINAYSFDEELPALEDYELWLRMAKQQAKFLFIDIPLTKYYYLTGKGSISKAIDSNLKALSMIENKYSAEYNMLNNNEIKAHELWKRKMMIHKALLNGNLQSAIKKQFKLVLFSPSIVNFISLLVLFLGPKRVFQLKAWLG